MASNEKRFTSFAELREFLGALTERKVANNTVVRYVTRNIIAVRLHGTDVVTYHHDGGIVLDSGGWQTATTKHRMNAFLPRRLSVWAKRGTWFVSCASSAGAHHKEFRDGMVV